MPSTSGRRYGTGALRQLPSGRWQARARDDTGVLRPAPFTFDTKLDAGRWLADYLNGDVANPIRDNVTLGAYAAAWVAAGTWKPRTRTHYQRIVATSIYPMPIAKLRLSMITTTHVRTWWAGLNPDTPVLRAHTYGLLRTIMNSAIADGIITSNPCKVRGASTAPTAHRPSIATLPELEVIADTMPPRLRATIDLAAWCGLRFGEITELRRGDLDLHAGVVHVRRGVTRTPGNVHIGPPKSRAGRRDVAIPPHLIDGLAEHLHAHVAAPPGALLFPAATDPDKNISYATLMKAFYPARASAGRPDLHFHDLRHTGATLAAATGATLAELMARMGHSTAGAALRYQHATSNRDQAIAEALTGFAGRTVIPLRKRSNPPKP
jgi:integrase